MNQNVVLIIGGCHVKGFPYELEDSFVYKINKFKDFQLKMEPNFAIKRLNKNLNLLNEVNHLMLQLGHYETTFPLRDYFFGKKNTNKKQSLSDSAYDQNEIDRTPVFEGNLRFYLGEFLKCQLQFLRDLFGKSLLDTQNIENTLDQFFSNLRARGFQSVTVLSNFYCPSNSANNYRRRLNKIFYDKSLKYGYQYLDAFSLLEENTKKTKYYYFDNIHLSKNSINILSDFINENLK